MIASASWDTNISICNAANLTSKDVLSGHTDWVNGCSWVNANTLLSVSHDCTVRAWNVSSHSSTVIGKHDNWVLSCATRNSRAVSSSYDSVIKVWDIDSKRLLNTFSPQTKRVNQCAFDKTGNLIASVSHDRTVRIWDTRNNQQVTFFATKGLGTCVAQNGDTIGVGDSLGNIYFLDIMSNN